MPPAAIREPRARRPVHHLHRQPRQHRRAPGAGDSQGNGARPAARRHRHRPGAVPGRRRPAGHRALPARQPRLQGTGRDIPPRPRAGHPGQAARAGQRRTAGRRRRLARRRGTPARRHQGGPRGQLGVPVARPDRGPRVRGPRRAHRRDDRLLVPADRTVPAAGPGRPGLPHHEQQSAGTTWKARPATVSLPVPFNKVMIATFYLTGMDIAHRLITWLDAVEHRLGAGDGDLRGPGPDGRPPASPRSRTASPGVVRAVSRGRLAAERVFIAPHAPVFPPYDPAAQDSSPARGPGSRLPPAVGRVARHLAPGRRHVRGLPALRRPCRRPGDHRPRHGQRPRQAGRERPRRLARPRHPAARGDGGPHAAAVGRRHRLREQRARRATPTTRPPSPSPDSTASRTRSTSAAHP